MHLWVVLAVQLLQPFSGSEVRRTRAKASVAESNYEWRFGVDLPTNGLVNRSDRQPSRLPVTTSITRRADVVPSSIRSVISARMIAGRTAYTTQLGDRGGRAGTLRHHPESDTLVSKPTGGCLVRIITRSLLDNHQYWFLTPNSSPCPQIVRKRVIVWFLDKI